MRASIQPCFNTFFFFEDMHTPWHVSYVHILISTFLNTVPHSHQQQTNAGPWAHHAPYTFAPVYTCLHKSTHNVCVYAHQIKCSVFNRLGQRVAITAMEPLAGPHQSQGSPLRPASSTTMCGLVFEPLPHVTCHIIVEISVRTNSRKVCL